MNNKPSLLWISHFLPYPLNLGARIRSYNLIQYLTDHFDLTLVIIDCKVNNKSQSTFEEFQSKLKNKINKIHYMQIDSINSILQKGYFFLKGLIVNYPIELDFFYSTYIEQKISNIMSQGFNYIHFDSIDLAKYFHLADLSKSCLNHHNVESSLLESMSKSRKPSFFYKRQARLMKALESKYCEKFRLNFTVSDLDTEVLRSFSKGTYYTVANGVDTDSINFKQRERNKIIKLGWLGGLDWNPNKEAVNWFIKHIWPIISNSYPEIEFHVAGRDSDKLLLNNIPNNQRISTIGYLDSIEEFMHSLDIYLVPLLTGGGTRLKILDAFARGTPVLSTSKGAEGINITHTQDILIADEIDQFLDIFKKLMYGEFDLDVISKNARKLVESEYNWAYLAERMASKVN